MNAKVLLVDDDLFVLNSISRSLYSEPYTLLTASSAEEGLALLQQQTCQVVVADYQMPGQCGLEFLAEVKQRYPDVVRIMLTGKGSLALYDKVLVDVDAFDLLLKPWNVGHLKTSIRNALFRHERMAA